MLTSAAACTKCRQRQQSSGLCPQQPATQTGVNNTAHQTGSGNVSRTSTGADSMADALTEMQARGIQPKAGSPASKPDKYRVRRIRGGWSFSWRENTEPPLLGTRY